MTAKIFFSIILTLVITLIILYIVYISKGGESRASVFGIPAFMKIIISNRSGVPIYEQIKAQISSAIFSGELREDDMLPSVRQLARDLKISVITTARAYADLEAEGFVTNVQGKGCYVLPRNQELARENALHKMEDSLGKAIAAAKTEGIAKEEVIERINILWESENE